MKKQIDENRLIQAALEEFTTFSYDDASLNNIIKNAEISKGSFYYRFKTKYDLFIFLLKAGSQKKWDYINERAQSDAFKTQSGDIFDHILVQAKIGIDFAYKYPEYYTLSKMFLKTKGTPVYQKAIKDLGQNVHQSMDQVAEQLLTQDNFNKQFSVDFVSKMLSLLLLSFDDIFFPDSESGLEQSYKYLEDSIAVFKYGLYRRD